MRGKLIAVGGLGSIEAVSASLASLETTLGIVALVVAALVAAIITILLMPGDTTTNGSDNYNPLFIGIGCGALLYCYFQLNAFLSAKVFMGKFIASGGSMEQEQFQPVVLGLLDVVSVTMFSFSFIVGVAINRLSSSIWFSSLICGLSLFFFAVMGQLISLLLGSTIPLLALPWDEITVQITGGLFVASLVVIGVAMGAYMSEGFAFLMARIR